MARLMLVDDHPVVRQGLSSFFDLHDDLEVVAEAGSLAEARSLLDQRQVDLILLDLQLPDGSGIVLLRELNGATAGPRILVLTSFLDEYSVREAIALGAAGFLLKHAGTRSLLDGVRAALRGELPLDPGAVRLLAAPHEDPLAQLTERERETLQLLAQGMSNRAIAQQMGVTEKTIKSHLGSVFAKLGLADRTKAALWAREHGL